MWRSVLQGALEFLMIAVILLVILSIFDRGGKAPVTHQFGSNCTERYWECR